MCVGGGELINFLVLKKGGGFLGFTVCQLRVLNCHGN